MKIAVLAGMTVLTAVVTVTFARAADQPARAVSDRTFVTIAAQDGMAQVELGKLASQKSSSADVKKLGERIVADHMKADEALKMVAEKKHIMLSGDIDAKNKAVRDRLSKLSGQAFDRAYLAAIMDDHRSDISAFKRESQTGKDSDIKSFASNTLPTLEEHLKMAESTDRTVIRTTSAAKPKAAPKHQT